MPIITNYFTELETGHKDFVRSFVHLKQSGALPFGKGALKKFGQDNELEDKMNGEEKVNFNSEMNDGKDRLPTKEKDKRPSGKGSKSGAGVSNDAN